MAGKLEEPIEQINGSNGDQFACVLADPSLGWGWKLQRKKASSERATFCPVLGFMPDNSEDHMI